MGKDTNKSMKSIRSSSLCVFLFIYPFFILSIARADTWSLENQPVKHEWGLEEQTVKNEWGLEEQTPKHDKSDSIILHYNGKDWNKIVLNTNKRLMSVCV